MNLLHLHFQHANMVYEHIWGPDNHNGNDINLSAGIDMDNKAMMQIYLNIRLLCGGFPCQIIL